MHTTTKLLGTMRRRLAAVGSCALRVAVAVAMAQTVAPSVLRAAPAGGFAIERDERRLRLALAMGRGNGVVGGRVDSAMVLYRFRIVATDRSGAPIAAAGSLAQWEATVRVIEATGGNSARPLVQLSNRSSDFTLPRPLGFRLSAGDSIELRVSPSSLASGDELQLMVDYESGSAIATRLPVLPQPARGAAVAGEVSKFATAEPALEWSWTPSQDGRLLAIAGLALELVRDASLEDAESGERLWSATLRDADGQSVFGKGGDVVRLGVAVQAGRTYRLRATRWSPSLEAGAAGELLALVLPAGSR